MKRNVLGVWLLMTVLALSAGTTTGCDDGGPENPPGDTDAGGTPVDGGDPLPDGGDGGPVIEPPSDAGTDGGTDAGTVAPKAYVRFVNAYLGLKNNPSDKADAPWAPYKIDLYVGDTKLFPVPVEPGDEAVTAYRELEVTPGQSVRFVVRDAESELSAAPVAASEAITLEEGDATDNDLDHAIGLMMKHRALEDTIQRARHYGAIATDALALFPASPMKQALEETVEFCICRSN